MTTIPTVELSSLSYHKPKYFPNNFSKVSQSLVRGRVVFNGDKIDIAIARNMDNSTSVYFLNPQQRFTIINSKETIIHLNRDKCLNISDPDGILRHHIASLRVFCIRDGSQKNAVAKINYYSGSISSSNRKSQMIEQERPSNSSSVKAQTSSLPIDIVHAPSSVIKTSAIKLDTSQEFDKDYHSLEKSQKTNSSAKKDNIALYSPPLADHIFSASEMNSQSPSTLRMPRLTLKALNIDEENGLSIERQENNIASEPSNNKPTPTSNLTELKIALLKLFEAQWHKGGVFDGESNQLLNNIGANIFSQELNELEIASLLNETEAIRTRFLKNVKQHIITKINDKYGNNIGTDLKLTATDNQSVISDMLHRTYLDKIYHDAVSHLPLIYPKGSKALQWSEQERKDNATKIANREAYWRGKFVDNINILARSKLQELSKITTKYDDFLKLFKRPDITNSITKLRQISLKAEQIAVNLKLLPTKFKNQIDESHNEYTLKSKDLESCIKAICDSYIEQQKQIHSSPSSTSAKIPQKVVARVNKVLTFKK